MNKSDITVGMIRNMQHCIGFDKNQVTGTKHRVMHAYRNYYYTNHEHKGWNALVDSGLAYKNPNINDKGLTNFNLTPEGFKFLSDLCGFKKIVEIEEEKNQ